MKKITKKITKKIVVSTPATNSFATAALPRIKKYYGEHQNQAVAQDGSRSGPCQGPHGSESSKSPCACINLFSNTPTEGKNSKKRTSAYIKKTFRWAANTITITCVQHHYSAALIVQLQHTMHRCRMYRILYYLHVSCMLHLTMSV